MAPEASAVESKTFYCVMGTGRDARPSSQVIPFGGERRVDGSGKVIYLPFKEIRFTEGKFTTFDPDFIAWLEKACKDPATGITDSHEEYLRRILPPEKNADRLAAKNEEQRAEINRLKAELEAQSKSRRA